VILTSADGANWSQRQPRTKIYLNSVACGDGKFVAVGCCDAVSGKVILTSADGENWIESQPVLNANLQKVVYGNGQFAAVEAGSRVFTSPDGLTWTTHATDDWGLIFSSSDGLNWMRRQLTSWQSVQGLTYGNGHFVAVNSGGILESGSMIGLVHTPNRASGLLSLSLEGPMGLDYTIQSSSDLMTWHDVTNAQSNTIILENLPLGSGRQFYRAYSQ
jgi:hypothetical protein